MGKTCDLGTTGSSTRQRERSRRISEVGAAAGGAETETVSWYAIKMGPGKYGIFDTFADENGRNAHLNGAIAKALFAKAEDLFAKAPEIAKPEVLAAKYPELTL